MKLNWLIGLAGLLAVATTMSGCANWGTGTSNGPHTQNMTYQKTPATRSSIAHDFNAYTKGPNAHNYVNGYTVNGFNQNLAEQLTKAADDVPGVDRATVVVSGADAIVGIRVRTNLGEQQARVIEQQVHAAARSVAPNIHIRVTSDSAMFDRLRNINSAIYNEATQRTSDVYVNPNATNKLTNTSTEFRGLLHDLGNTGKTPSPYSR
ncbi:YhcN/YlaJ family sporulation lipoprotein [Brevibacillus sp. NRS-1366]|uniref:YhcN/YlaJ family sporulation lipoprotein n=1 Tax=Brevibacillus sp. NRS-1366 TaxID=3233899 RepID=UPI003D226541